LTDVRLKTVFTVGDTRFDERDDAHVALRAALTDAAQNAETDEEFGGAVLWDTEEVPAGRFDELLDEYGADPHDRADVADWQLDREAKYLLVERNLRAGGHWLSSHDSPATAADYHDRQEYAEEWEIVCLVDLESGEELEASTDVVTTWLPSRSS
jgi:hypothetical protein